MHVDGATDEEWTCYLTKEIASSPPGVYKQQTQMFLDRKGWKSIETSKQFTKVNDEMYNSSSVFCLSKIENSIPMFSYYADCHRGIAIEFTFSTFTIPCGFSPSDYYYSHSPRFGQIIIASVDYLEDYPDLCYPRLRMDPLYIRKLIFLKAIEWRHEEEFRIFRSKIPAGPVQFTPDLLTKVILGCKAGHDELALVKAWLKDWPTPVSVSKAVKSKSRFELNIVPV